MPHIFCVKCYKIFYKPLLKGFMLKFIGTLCKNARERVKKFEELGIVLNIYVLRLKVTVKRVFFTSSGDFIFPTMSFKEQNILQSRTFPRYFR